MPLLPVIMASGAALGLDRYAVGLVATNVAFVLGLALFGQIARQVTEDDQTAWRACLLLIAYPGSMIFSAPYQESLAFALQGAAILAWLNRRPLLSALGLAWASLARLTALAMPVALVVQWATDLARRRPTRHSALLVLASGLAGLGLFLLYMGFKLGDPLIPFKAHAAWGRRPASAQNVLHVLRLSALLMRESPKLAMISAAILAWVGQEAVRAALARWASPAKPAPVIEAGGRRLWIIIAAPLALGFLIAVIRGKLISQLMFLSEHSNHLAMVAFLGLGVRAWLKRGPFWGCLVLIPPLQGMATGTTNSLSRIILTAFPGFIDGAELLRSRVALAAVLIALLIAQLHAIYDFVNWVAGGWM
jgi:hypothetical protein